MDKRKYFFFIFRLAEVSLENGAEIKRVESTVNYLSKKYELEGFDAFIMINGLMMSLQNGDESLQAKVKEIPISPINLGRIEAINVLSRDIVEDKIDFEGAKKRLDEIKDSNYASNRSKLAAYALGSSTFGYLFASSLWDAAGAFFLGAILGFYILYILPKTNLTDFLTNLSGSILVSVLACIMVYISPTFNLSSLIAGGIISLLPGVAMVNSIRYLFDEDYLSGAGMLMDAVMTSAAISVGVGIVLRVAEWI
ncbi:hypothetical protein BG261_05695 [Floricoccus tropicus]|uniref:Threonine/serine exporter-like N-terminal domain-containing protein n=1 Tax=Floricoccus tropicus TaxID=1859473 RepID=A0A1E8GKW5_9LACT|nr:threonine/serine exporter family protein [Floricoccus tropicus]OFI48879.1 hypothetical protein BG261_05695 [Floricoccus tropicus]